MKECKVICPYCHKEVTDIVKEDCACSCRRKFKLSQSVCPSCFSQVIKVGQYYFCSSIDCPTYSDIFKCQFSLDKICNTCNRQLVKVPTIRTVHPGTIISGYKYINVLTGCALNNPVFPHSKLPSDRQFLAMEISFHPVLHDLYLKFKNQNPENA